MRLPIAILAALAMSGCSADGVQVFGEQMAEARQQSHEVKSDLGVLLPRETSGRVVDRTPFTADDGTAGTLSANTPVHLDPQSKVIVPAGTIMEADLTMLEGTQAMFFAIILDAIVGGLVLLGFGFVSVKFWKWARKQLKHSHETPATKPKSKKST